MRKKRNILPIVFALMTILLTACTGISEEKAKDVADEFVRERVVFFTKDEVGNTTLPPYRITNSDTYKEKGNWYIIMHVEATLKNQTKDTDVEIMINGKGEVIRLNGREIVN